MPEPVVVFVHSVERFINRLGKACWWLAPSLIIVLLIEAVMRYTFNRPQIWSLEVSEFIFGAYFVLGGAYVLMHERHVRMDALYSRWPRKRQALIDAITFSIIAIYLIIFVVGGIGNVLFSWRFGMVSQSAWGPPMTPIRIIIVVGGFFMVLISITRFIRDIAVVRGKEIPRQIEWTAAIFKGKL